MDECKDDIENICPFTHEELGERAQRIMAVAFRRYNRAKDFVELDIEDDNIASLYGDFSDKKMLLELMVVAQDLSRRCTALKERLEGLEDAFLSRE